MTTANGNFTLERICGIRVGRIPICDHKKALFSYLHIDGSYFHLDEVEKKSVMNVQVENQGLPTDSEYKLNLIFDWTLGHETMKKKF